MDEALKPLRWLPQRMPQGCVCEVHGRAAGVGGAA